MVHLLHRLYGVDAPAGQWSRTGHVSQTSVFYPLVWHRFLFQQLSALIQRYDAILLHESFVKEQEE